MTSNNIWTAGADLRLEAYVKRFKDEIGPNRSIKWGPISNQLGYTKDQCRRRWTILDQKRKSRTWSPDECSILSFACTSYLNHKPPMKINWTIVSRELPGRSPHVCRVEWERMSFDQYKAESTKNKRVRIMWTIDQENLLLDLGIVQYSNNNPEIALSAIRRRWKQLLRRPENIRRIETLKQKRLHNPNII